jgi:hypothetical protein
MMRLSRREYRATGLMLMTTDWGLREVLARCGHVRMGSGHETEAL